MMRPLQRDTAPQPHNDSGATAVELTKEMTMARPTTVHHCASGTEYAPGSFESCIRCNPPTDEQLKNELAYYFDHEPTQADVEAYREWRLEHLEIDTAEYAEAVQQL